MRFKRLFTTLDTHVNGCPARTVTGGLPYIPGKTIEDKVDYLNEKADWIRKVLVGEPRGSENHVGIILTEPCTNDADAGIICMDNEGYDSIGLESIVGVSTAMIESGLVDIVEPYTYICLETVQGHFHIKARVKDEVAVEIAYKNMDVEVVEKVSGEGGFGGYEEIHEEKSGRAYVTGMHTFVVDPDDPLL